MEKQKLILRLHKEGKITEDEAQILLQENERVVYIDRYVQPFVNPAPIVPYPLYPFTPQLPQTFYSSNVHPAAGSANHVEVYPN